MQSKTTQSKPAIILFLEKILSSAGSSFVLALAFGSLLAASSVFLNSSDRHGSIVFEAFQPLADKAATERQFVELRRELDRQKHDIALLRRASGSQPIGVSAIESARLSKIEERQAALEAAILSSPEKALAVPLLRRDVEQIRDATSAADANVVASVDRVYDLVKWLAGGVAAGLISLFATVFMMRKKPDSVTD